MFWTYLLNQKFFEYSYIYLGINFLQKNRKFCKIPVFCAISHFARTLSGLFKYNITVKIIYIMYNEYTKGDVIWQIR